jgi:aryl-alcohol dehydrogenase-like predicted oxidoreductase
MKTRTLGKTGIELPILSFGASSLGQEFRSVALDDALKSVQVALDCGLNFIDTSPFYGRGISEVLLGVALRGVPRDSYKLCTKIGRYDLPHFDFSAKRVAESIDVSLHRLGTDHLDIVLCHDIEFVPMQQIVDETIPALRKAKQAGKVKAIGFSGYPQKIFKFICDQAEVDCVLSYNQHTLQNTRFSDETVPYLKAKGIGVMNAGPFSARLLTNAPLPAWLKEPETVKAAARAPPPIAPPRAATSLSSPCSSRSSILTSPRRSRAAPTRPTSAIGPSGPRSRLISSSSPRSWPSSPR